MATLKVGIDAREADRGAAQADRALQRVQAGARRTDDALQKNAKSFNDVSKSAGVMSRALVAIPFALIVGVLLKQIDAYQALNNRLKLVTASSAELEVVQRRLFEVAQQNRVGLESTVELYSRIARSAKQLNLSQQEILDLTDSISKALTLSGTSAENASAALVQFGQALASGRLSGDELRSVLENAPRLAQALAEGMGVTVGQLRNLGAEGKLTSQALVEAIRAQSDTLREEFAKTVPTVSQGWTTIKNAALQSIREIDQQLGEGGSLAQSMVGLAQFIQGPFTEAVLTWADAWRIALVGVGDFSGAAAEYLELFGLQADEVFISINNSVSELPLTIVNAIRTAGVELFSFFQRLETRALLAVNAFKEIGARLSFNDAAYLNALSERKRLEEELAEEQRSIETDRRGRVQREIDQQRELAALAERRRAAEANLGKVDLDKKPGGGGGGPTAEELEAAKKAAKELETFAKKVMEDTRTPAEEFARAVDMLDKALAKGLITREAYTRAILAERDAQLQAEDALRQADPVYAHNNELLKEAAALTEALRTPYEQLSAEVQRYIELLQLGAINEETYARAVGAATDKYKESVEKKKEQSAFLDEITRSAARNIQSAFADFLFNPLEKGFDGMLSSFVNVLHRMASEALSAQVFKILADQFKSLAASSGGGQGFWSTVFSYGAQLFGGGKAHGGHVDAGKSYMVGEKGPELVSFDRSGWVSTARETAAAVSQQQAPVVNVTPQIINVRDPKEIPTALESSEGTAAILNVMTQNVTAIREILKA